MSPARLTIEDVRAIATARGGKCLSSSYSGCSEKLLWECSEGHQWQASLTSINRGRWCKRCACRNAANARRLSLDQMQDIAATKGGRCLSTTYANTSTKLLWECAREHQWMATPAHVKAGTWCARCTKPNAQDHRKLPIEEMCAIAASRGGVCLSEQYINSATALRWRCSEGHVWLATPSSIKRGSWCAVCSKRRSAKRLSAGIEAVHRLAASRGGTCLSLEYKNSKTKVRWQCQYKHEWEATPDSVRGGNWCPVCAGNARGTIERMDDLARRKGGRCLSPEYFNSSTKLLWECSEGHTWQAKPSHIAGGHWCPSCEGNRRLSIEQMREVARSRGGQCLSDEYVNAFQKLRWECANGHRWEAIPNAIMKGHWCGTCSSGLGERICRAVFEQMFRREFPRVKPRWLLNSSRNLMELDGYCEFLGMAFEHHGDQHYVDGTLFTCGDDFLTRRKEDDAAKARLCRERRITLVVVPQIPERTSIDEVTGVIIEQLLSAGISIPPEFDPGDLDLTYAYSTPPSLSNLDALRRIALDRGGKCLSREYRGAHQKMDWECGRCGHQWSATAASVRAGSWCKVCGHKAGTRKRSLGIELMHSIAKQRGGSCLSTEYANANTPLEWECKEGHRWSATPHMVKNGKTWCAICYGERRRRLR